MKHISETLSKMRELTAGRTICMTCGAEVIFAVDQYSRYCPRCSTLVKIPPAQVLKHEDVKPPQCFLCNDSGLVIFQVQEGPYVYDQLAKCFCNAGLARKEKYPSVTQATEIADLRHLTEKRRETWCRRHPNSTSRGVD